MKVLICGSRNWPTFDDDLIRNYVESLPPDAVVIEGGAPGADSHARFWAAQRGLEVRELKADWQTHGKKAGPIRNRRMLDLVPDRVAAFQLGRSRGTQDTIDEATRRGIPVEVFRRVTPSGARP